MSEKEVNDEVKRRREARRQKILSNMDNRLKKIANVPPSDESFSTNLVNNLENIEKIVIPHENKVQENERKELPIVHPVQPDEVMQNILLKCLSKKNEDLDDDTNFLLILRKDVVHVLFLSVIVLCFFRLGLGGIVNENILIPFLTLKLAQLVAQFNSSMPPSVALVLSMIGIQSTTVTTLIKTLIWTLTLSKDLCLYLFVYLFGNEILSALFEIMI